MIISASRRTDIPAYYSKWFANRLKEKYVLAPNPYNKKRLSYISLSPDIVDCIVFWTKNPSPIIAELDRITEAGYSFYFQFTLTPYGRDMEPALPSKHRLVETFLKLSAKIGPERVVWRYDPVIINENLTPGYHFEQFGRMCGMLSGATKRCIISFIDTYRTGFRDMGESEILAIADGFSKTASQYGIKLFTCAEKIDLSRFGIGHASCIDKGLIEHIIGCRINAEKDSGQRPACGCIESIDIGSYDTCPCGCRYCYAVRSRNAALINNKKHNPHSPVLSGTLMGNEIIKKRVCISQKTGQLSLY